MEDDLKKVMEAFNTAYAFIEKFNKKHGYVILGYSNYGKTLQVKDASFFGKVTWTPFYGGDFIAKATTIFEGITIVSIHNKEEYEAISGKHFTL